MLGLLVKDIMNLKVQVKQILLVIVLYSVIFIPNGGSGFSGMMVMLSTILIITAIGYDDKARWDKYALTMPVSRRDLVVSKYLLLLLLNITGAVLALIALGIVGMVGNNTASFAEEVGGLGVIAGLMLLMFSILMPLLFKYGVEKARLLMIVCFLIPTLIILGASYLSKRFPGELNIVNTAGDLLTKYMWAIPVIGVLALIISAMCSIHIVERKDY